MNKRAFTLMELLGVISILALLALITTVGVTSILKSSKRNLANTQLELIKAAAESWSVDNLDKLPEKGSCIYITLDDLKKSGLLESSVINPMNNQEYPNDLKIKITNEATSHGKSNMLYEVNPNSVAGCSYAY